MQIFISWSGEPARNLADFLQTWLCQVIQELDPFMSKNSIEKGARWSPEIAKRLEETTQAIVCVTRENQAAEWLNFEAGALAKATESRVRTLLIDITPADVTGPLSEFQHTNASSKDDVWSLIVSVNEHCDRPLNEQLLKSTYDREWPAFEQRLSEVIEAARQAPTGKKPNSQKRERGDEDVLAEIIDRVRKIDRARIEDNAIIRAILEQLVGPVQHNAFENPFRPIQISDLELTIRQSNTVRKIESVGPGATLSIRRDSNKNEYEIAEFSDFIVRGSNPYVRVLVFPAKERDVIPLDAVVGVDLEAIPNSER